MDAIQKNQFAVCSFYNFFPAQEKQLQEFKNSFTTKAKKENIRGLLIIAEEGLNGTLSGPFETLKKFIDQVGDFFDSSFDNRKWCQAPNHPFRLFKIKKRKEIVTTCHPEVSPLNTSSQGTHLTPAEWNEILKSSNDYFLVDTRNWYETKVGKFKEAIDPKIDDFKDFPKFIETQNLDKDKKILMYCTGGIRCEKGVLELQKMGYKNVFQLQGGILNYLKEFPEQEFEGECFVFDHRVAVDQRLQPSQNYKLCPHCGQPGSTTIHCQRCESPAVICDSCLEAKDEALAKTCSKNCSYHYHLNPKKKGKKQQPGYQLTTTK